MGQNMHSHGLTEALLPIHLLQDPFRLPTLQALCAAAQKPWHLGASYKSSESMAPGSILLKQSTIYCIYIYTCRVYIYVCIYIYIIII